MSCSYISSGDMPSIPVLIIASGEEEFPGNIRIDNKNLYGRPWDDLVDCFKRLLIWQIPFLSSNDAEKSYKFISVFLFHFLLPTSFDYNSMNLYKSQ